jgi:glycosyltransferase involved in cell wall biosynthesis
MEKKIIFISWAPYCSRSDNIAREFNGKSYMVYYDYLGSNYVTILLKYLLQMIKSLQILFRERPDTVFVMSPPVIACLPAFLYCKIFRKSFIIDAHTAAFLHKRWKNRNRLNSFFTKRALRTCVTNEFLADIVKKWGGEYIILTDVPIKFPNYKRAREHPNKLRKVITLVNTFAEDEPLEDFISAAEKFDDINFFITGKITDSVKHYVKGFRENIRFTGFLSDYDYGHLLYSSDLVCVFTKRNHTMLRGAYEAIYLGKPVVMSDWDVLKKNFPFGTVFVSNTVKGIADGINEALASHDKLSQDAQTLRSKKIEIWEQRKGHIMKLIVEAKCSN